MAFSQRRVSFVEGSYSGVAGFDFFRLEPFGMPILEVLPSKVKGSELYELMHRRLSGYYKGTVKSFVKNQRQLSSHSSYLLQSSPGQDCGNIFALGSAAADVYEEIAPISTEEVVTGPIPSKGFTLRLITGGTGATVCCSRCPWINRCQGCILPDADDVEYELLDGESIAVDWHFVVFEDLLDTQLASTLSTHPSIAQEKAFLHDTKVPLSKCLDKFNEQESLEGVVCPKCHEDNSLKKSFMLWRLPPVLIVQLKRFQFDRTSRRKLNNRIDFPLTDLDLTNYIAPTRFKKLQIDTAEETKAQSLDNDGVCSSYDLYSVIHHVGALGGGHYVTTTRFDQAAARAHLPASSSSHASQESFNKMTKKFVKSIRALTSSNNNTVDTVDSSHNNHNNSNHSSGLTNSSSTSAEVAEREGDQARDSRDYRWFTFNDNIVSEVTDVSDINSPSAYVLFYIRKDIESSSDIQSLLRSQLMLTDHSPPPSPPSINSDGLQQKQKALKQSSSPLPKSPVPNITEEPEASSQSNSQFQQRRHQYILAKRGIPSKKTGHGGVSYQRREREEVSSPLPNTSSEADNNCILS